MSKNIATISARSYAKDKQGSLEIFNLPDINLKGKKVLVVDETADTGATLHAVAELFRKQYEVAELRTAVLVINSAHCKKLPDFHILTVDRWVVFPWERKEFPEYFAQ